MSLSRIPSAIRSLVAEARWRGFWGSVLALKLNKFGSMKYLVHEDEFGNRYFENPSTSYGRDRWVEYSEAGKGDSVKVPPEWHAWIHHIIDERPSETPLPKPRFQAQVTENFTGTRKAYVPRNNPLSRNFEGLAKEKVEAWEPNRRSSAKGDADQKDVYDLK